LIAKVIPSSGSGSGSFGRMANYVTDQANDGEKADWIRISNCITDDYSMALTDIKAVQDSNTRAKHKAYHFVLSFPQGEKPSDEIIQAAEDQAIEALGFDEHQRISALHTNTDAPHLHVVVNTVHPETLKVHNQNNDFIILDRVCKYVEQEHGLTKTNRIARVQHESSKVSQQDNAPDPRQVVDTDLAGTSSASPSKDFQNKPVQPIGKADGKPNGNSKAYSMETHGGMRSFASWVKDNAGTALVSEAYRDGASGESLQKTAAKYDLKFVVRGNGMVIASRSNKLFIKASEIDRELSRGKLEARLGKFNKELNITDAHSVKYTSAPKQRSQESRQLYDQFKASKDSNNQVRSGKLANARSEYMKARNEIYKQHKAIREKMSWRGRREHRDQLTQARQRQLDQLKQRYEMQRQLIINAHKMPAWNQWLTQQARSGPVSYTHLTLPTNTEV